MRQDRSLTRLQEDVFILYADYLGTDGPLDIDNRIRDLIRRGIEHVQVYSMHSRAQKRDSIINIRSIIRRLWPFVENVIAYVAILSLLL